MKWVICLANSYFLSQGLIIIVSANASSTFHKHTSSQDHTFYDSALLLVYFINLFHAFALSVVLSTVEHSRLLRDLLDKYDKMVRPVTNASQPVTVTIRLTLHQIRELVGVSFITIMRMFSFDPDMALALSANDLHMTLIS